LDARVNYLEILACLSILLHLLAFLLYNNQDFLGALATAGIDSPRVLDGVLVAASIVFFVFGAVVCCFRVGEAQYRANIAGRAATVVAKAVLSVQTDLTLAADSLVHAFSTSMSARTVLSVGARIEHPTLGAGCVDSVMEHGRGAAVEVTFDSGAKHYYETERDLARLSLVVPASGDVHPEAKGAGSTDNPASNLVFFRDFVEACTRVFASSGMKVRDAAILESIYAVLKLAHEDDDPDSPFLSPRMRSILATDRGLPMSAVRLHTHPPRRTQCALRTRLGRLPAA
jgi:hypothetical protein